MQKKEPPVRGEPADAVRAPRSAGAGKEPPVRDEHACAVRVPRIIGAENRSRPSGANPLTQFARPGQPVPDREKFDF